MHVDLFELRQFLVLTIAQPGTQPKQAHTAIFTPSLVPVCLCGLQASPFVLTYLSDASSWCLTWHATLSQHTLPFAFPGFCMS
jgi:hypothetical protein